MKQLVFTFILLLTIAIFIYSVSKIIALIKLSKKTYPIKDIGKRIMMTLDVAFFQSKIFRRPVIGFMHAMVFWGFMVICLGTIEMTIDGIFGTERILSKLGIVYDIISASGDIFGLIVLIAIIAFLARRILLHVKRFEGVEMVKKHHTDANIALSIILLLMVSLLSMNASYCALYTGKEITGTYPIGMFLKNIFGSIDKSTLYIVYEISWWAHILLVFFFANYLPYSKHFHVFMSIPNVFVSRLEPLGKLYNMESVTKEVRIMMDPNLAYAAPAADAAPPERFGVKDIEDGTWKYYVDSLSCTQCGRCTSVCPANITGKLLSPRKIFIDYRARMNEKGRKLLTNKDFTDNKSFIRDYITEEEIWACTTCNACAQECPVNINHPSLIVDMRRYLAMEEGSVPTGIKMIFSNIENNGAPWQYSPQDRLLWAQDLVMNKN